MVAMATKEKVTEAPQESSPEEHQVIQWFCYTPCPGVTYCSFDQRHARPAKVERRGPAPLKVGLR